MPNPRIAHRPGPIVPRRLGILALATLLLTGCAAFSGGFDLPLGELGDLRCEVNLLFDRIAEQTTAPACGWGEHRAAYAHLQARVAQQVAEASIERADAASWQHLRQVEMGLEVAEAVHRARGGVCLGPQEMFDLRRGLARIFAAAPPAPPPSTPSE